MLVVVLHYCLFSVLVLDVFVVQIPLYILKEMLGYLLLWPQQLLYTVSQKTVPLFTAYNFRNIEQISTKLGKNHVLFMLNITP